MAKQVTLNIKALNKAVDELETIKSQITAHAGTQAARLKAAREAVIETVTVVLPDAPASDSFADVVSYADSLKAHAEQALEEAVTGHLRETADAATTGLDALRESFKVKAEAATAMRSVLVSIGLEEAEAVTVPTLKGTRSKGGNGGKSSANKRGDFYIIRDGERIPMTDSQNKFASLAWYHGAALGCTVLESDGGKRASAPNLTAFLESHGVTPTAGQPWEYVNPDGFGMGMMVSETDAPTDDETLAEEAAE